MAINPLLSSVSTVLALQTAPGAVRAPVTASDVAIRSGVNLSDSAPPAPVLASAALVSASSNFAQLGTLLQIAQSGTDQVSALLVQLQSLARQVRQSGPDEAADINNAFQRLLTQLDSVVANLTFGGTKLFTGNLAGSGSGAAGSLSLPDLTAEGLFGETPPDVATPENAASAIASLSSAQGTVGNAATAIDTLLGELDFATASVDTALANSAAAGSTLTEGDLSGVISSFLSQSALLTQAQTGNISGNLLSLLQE